MGSKEVATRIGKILKNLRTRKGLSQVNLSLMTELSTRHYQEIESGKRNCQVDTLTKILSAYQLSVFSFFSSFLIEDFQKWGASPLYDIFGDRTFALRRFDLNGLVTYQCEMSREITETEDKEVIGIANAWDDLADPILASFVKDNFSRFIEQKIPLPSWKVQIVNQKTKMTTPFFLGYGRYCIDEKDQTTGIEIILFKLE